MHDTVYGAHGAVLSVYGLGLKQWVIGWLPLSTHNPGYPRKIVCPSAMQLIDNLARVGLRAVISHLELFSACSEDSDILNKSMSEHVRRLK